jgi:tetratricopeptide (TPR) repeat protein
MACVRINKLRDGEKALCPIENISRSTMSHRDYAMPNGCYGHYLLGTIYERQQKYQEAKNHFIKALEINPTLWVAYEKLVKMGEDIMPNKVFIQSKAKNIYGKRIDEI